MKKLLTLIILLFSTSALYAENSYYLCHRLSVSDGLPSNDVLCLVQDDRGFVWLGTGNGICRYDGSRIVKYTDITTKDGHHRIGGIAFLWLSKDHSKLMASTVTRQTITYDLRESKFTGYHFEPKGLVYVNRNKGIIRVAKIAGYEFNTDKFGHLYIIKPDGTRKTVWLVKDTSQSGSRTNKYQVARDSKGRFYIATYGNGLFVWDPKDDSINHVTSEDPRQLIATNLLTSIMVDRDDNIWVGNFLSGVSIIKRISGLSANYLYPNQHGSGDDSNSIGALMYYGSNHLIVGMQNGSVYNYDISRNQFALVGQFPKRVNCMLFDKNGHLWTGTLGGLYLDYKKFAPERRITFGSDWINRVLEDKYERKWVAAFRGGLTMVWRNGSKWQAKHFFKTGDNASNIRDATMSAGRWLWFTCDDGLGCVDTWKKNISETDVKLFNTRNHGLVGDQALNVYVARSGLIYVGVAGRGLCAYKFDGNDIKLIKTYDVTNGLITNTALSVLEDMYGNLWVAQEEGVARINIRKNNSADYRFSTSVLGNTFNEKTACSTPGGNLFFGSYNGLLHIKGKPVDYPHGKVSVTDLLVGGHSVSDSLNIFAGKDCKIALPSSVRSVALAFSDFDYAETSSSLFQYYLEGIDKGWRDGTTLKLADYNNLKPGSYVFHVRRIGDAKSEGTLAFKIRQPWYNTWWAWTIYIVVVMALILFFAYNASERIRLHQQMEVERQLNNFRIDFFTHIAHEFRTPLAIMQNAVDKLNADERAKSLGKLVRTVSKGMTRLSKLVDQLMDFRKMSTGNMKLKVGYGDIISFVRDVYFDFWPIAEQKDINIVFTPFAKKYEMWFDRKAIGSVAYNLISNAIKYTPQGGNVFITMKLDGDNLSLRVADDGEAISDERKQHLFEPFMHGYASAGGMGIGLYLAREMSRLHHGDLIYSRENGETVFTMTIPADEASYQADNHNTQPLTDTDTAKNDKMAVNGENIGTKSLLGEPVNNIHVAVVEDDQDMMLQLREELGSYFIIDAYMDGKSAIDGIHEHIPALILCDVMLPGIDGYEVVRQVRADKKLKSLPIILLTALEDDDHQIKGYKAGADDYMTKPCNYRILLTRMAQLIMWNKVETKKAEDENKEIEKEENKMAEPDNKVIVSVADKHFIDNVTAIMTSHIADPQFTIDDIAAIMRVGRTKLYGKVKDLTGMSPNKYFTKMKMEKAAELLSDSSLNIGEIGFQIGIQEQSYFYRTFKSYYGVAPSTYRKNLAAN